MLTLKKIILIGRAECGKTTLTQALRGHKLQYHKTQAVNRHDVVIDTPGEYAENRELARALILYSYEADVIALMLSSTEDYSLFSPNIAAGATRPVIGSSRRSTGKTRAPIVRSPGCIWPGAKPCSGSAPLPAKGSKRFWNIWMQGRRIAAMSEFYRCIF